MSKAAEMECLVEQIMEKVGRIDVLINNAGFGVFERVEETKVEIIEEMFSVNVVGLIALTKAVLPYMFNEGQGHIINIASQAGKLATPKSSVYAATKHAVLGFTNGLRMELIDRNITVSAVNPGPIKTPFFDRADQEGMYVKNVRKWMLDPQKVASATVRLIEKPKRELNLPQWMNMGSRFYQLMPTLVEKIAGKKLNQK
ncbi:putative oxidoreductase [Halalkalibacter krulwichiae]|uniref:Putative oxidoreductase n=2 Tax=Halalkalibacter krulwichiae TaxID=199441 RepID=A0A1X9MGA3_9BACI|nr:putative oxidoreductase [Halalkalibacter krulwichiae]